MTGFSAKVRSMVIEREGGRCAVCGKVILGGGHIHHRLPRGQGGDDSPVTNGVANGLHICPADHDKIETNRAWARVFGYLIPRWPDGIAPAEVSVYYRGGMYCGGGVWVLLGDDGTLNPEGANTMAREVIG
jgi:hypothetical protein